MNGDAPIRCGDKEDVLMFHHRLHQIPTYKAFANLARDLLHIIVTICPAETRWTKVGRRTSVRRKYMKVEKQAQLVRMEEASAHFLEVGAK